MFKNLFKRFAVAGLNILRYAIYIVIAPILVVFMLYGMYFIITAFLWVVLVDAAFVTAVLVFCTNFLMFFVALFDGSLWVTMGNMWSWLWGWFAGGNIALWPHFVRSFPPYFIAGFALILFYKIVKRLNARAKQLDPDRQTA